MKRVLVCALAMLLALTACVQQEPVAAATTSEPAAAATEEPTPEPTAEPAVEAPYIDARKPYTYIWENERDRKWEEDIVFFADTYLDPYRGHPLLSDRITNVCLYTDPVMRYSSEGKSNFFDPELKERFIERINELILSIPEKTDFELAFGIYEAAAMMHDAHTRCFSSLIDDEDVLPLIAVPVETESGTCAVIEYAPESVKEILGTQLIAINEVPLSEVVERMRPLISSENEYAVESEFYSDLNPSQILRYVGVLDNGNTVPITVRDRAGDEKRYEIDLWPMEDFARENLAHYTSGIGNEDGDMGICLRDRNSSSDVWYKMLMDGEALYLRLNTCAVDESAGQIFEEAFSTAKESGKCKKILVDFRQNDGGYADLSGNFLTLANGLQTADAKVYVLIDGGSFSSAIMIPAMLRRRTENVRLIGTPGGQPVRFFEGSSFVLKNSGIYCRCSTGLLDAWPGYEGDALMPDVTVYQTLEDFCEGYDSVLKYILEQ